MKVLLVDDHDLVRDGIKALLSGQNTYSEILEAKNGREAVDQYVKNSPDVVLMDINMPELTGVESTIEIRKIDSSAKILALSMNDDRRSITQMLEAGALGYVLKTSLADELFFAIEMLMNNESYFSPKVTAKMMNGFVHKNKSAGPDNSAIHDLSEREIQVLQGISEGLTNKEIGVKLFISDRTVDTHRRNMLEKTGAKNSAMLVKIATLEGVIK
ncbi:MAG: response regulator transcription factor [Flavobacteriales bacterium]|nr:response regulator transcription factor [Flavobacteriales bacterium]